MTPMLLSEFFYLVSATTQFDQSIRDFASREFSKVSESYKNKTLILKSIENEFLSVGEIVKITNLSTETVTLNLKRFEKEGLVESFWVSLPKKYKAKVYHKVENFE